MNWKKIDFCLTATGQEKYLIIGNNYSDDYAGCFSQNNTGYYSGYLYIDHVSLIKPLAQTVYYDTSFCKGNDVTLDISQLIDEPDNITPAYTWNDGSHEQIRTLYLPGFYEVLVQNGCAVDTVKITLSYPAYCPEIFFIPNAFSPNGDGVNDRFRIIDENITVTGFEIYNRWGGLVFSSENAAEGWDGKLNDQLQPVGVYLYLLDYTTNITEQEKRKTGYVTLIY